MKGIMFGLMGLILALSILYGMYWLAKTVSYQVFYEDMVQETVQEMVKEEYLR